jgi:putative transposase
LANYKWRKLFNALDKPDPIGEYLYLNRLCNYLEQELTYIDKQLGTIKSQRTLINLFKSNSILQFNKNSNKYFLISPFDYEMEYTSKRETNCGIDLGIRTMATVYSPNRILEIGTNLLPIIDKYNKKMDKIKSDKDLYILSVSKYNKLVYKYGSRMRNRVDDLHKKVSEYLTTNFENIHLGKISTSSIISNKRSNLYGINKRRLNVLSFYKFTETIKKMGKKYNCDIKEIDEYMTSKMCHHCKNIHKDLGSKKIYKCEKCKIEIDRDINSGINMYIKGFS